MKNDERQFEELLNKATFDDKPDYRHRDKLHQELLSAFAGRQWREERQSRQIGVWRTIMQNGFDKLTTSRTMRLAAAAVIIIAGVIGVQFLTGTSAYAQIVEEIRNARTVVYTLITQTNQGNGDTVKTDVAYKEPGHLRTTTVDGYIAIVDSTSGKMISIMPQGGYTLGEIKNLDKTGGHGPFESMEAMKNLPDKADEDLGAKEIDGIDCDGYKVTQGDLITTVWLAVKTGDLVQIEHKYASAPGMNRIIKNIRFDIKLEDSLFSLTPPAGYKSFGVELKENSAIQTEEAFVNWLRWWANGNTDDTFPPMVAGSEIAKVCMDMAKQGKLKNPSWENVDPGQMFNALLFVAKLPKESNWRYAGNGVKINTPDTPIFWYRPAGSQMYRVIYADLTVREMAEDQLPK
jgi:outer membrane lipoprotein-sorting protein